MSLINQVLKDIDSRERIGSEPGEDALNSRGGRAAIRSRAAERTYNTKILLLAMTGSFVLALLLSVLMVSIWENNKYKKTMHQPVIAQAVKQHSNAGAISALQKFSTLNGIKVEHGVDQVGLFFDMDQVPLVRVDMDVTHQNLNITLLNTKAEKKLENLDIPGLGHFTVQSQQVDQNLKLNLQLPFQAKLAKIEPQEYGISRGVHISLLHIQPIVGGRQAYPSVNNSSADLSQPLIRPAVNGQPALSQSKIDIRPISSIGNYKGHLTNAYEQAINLVNHGRVGEATARLRKEIVSFSADPKLVVTLVKLLIKQSKFEDAVMITTSSLANYPHHPELLKLRAQVEFMQNKIEQALSTLTSSTPSMLRYPDYYALMASIYLKTGEPMLAATIYRKLVEIQPSKAIWWVGMGVSMQALEQNNVASEAYKRALSLNNLEDKLRIFTVRQLSRL
jgi:predicted Zn-dependent protease